MKEAAALEGQFAGWTTEDRDARLARLIVIINDHVLTAVSSVVFQHDYSEVISDKLSKETDAPYWLIYHGIMELVYRWELANGIREKVNFIFDEQFKQSDLPIRLEQVAQLARETAECGWLHLAGCRR